MRMLRLSLVGTAVLALLLGSTFGVAAQAGEDPTSRPPIPSAGCGSSTVESGQHPVNELEVGDLERTWAMYVP